MIPHMKAKVVFIGKKQKIYPTFDNIYRLARMGRNFDDYPGFQPKTTFMYYFAHDCK